MKKLTNVLIFMTGAMVGASTAWYFLKSRYEQLAEEEIESVKAAYSSREKETGSGSEHSTFQEKTDIMEYAKRLHAEGYTEYSQTVEKPKSDEGGKILPVSPTPYVISPEEFGEMDGYTQISLTYFADGVLADEDDEPLEDVEDIVGDALEHFGDYEDDSVYVRNDAKRCDYEILKNPRNFHEIRRNRPPLQTEDDDEED